jgi:hypothetical protein
MTNNVLPTLAVSCGRKRGFLGTWACDSSKDAGGNASMVSRTHSSAGVPESLKELVIDHFSILELAWLSRASQESFLSTNAV